MNNLTERDLYIGCWYFYPPKNSFILWDEDEWRWVLNGTMNVADVNPIPLTEQILLNSGFSDNGIGEFWKEFGDKLAIRNRFKVTFKKISTTDKEIIEIKYFIVLPFTYDARLWIKETKYVHDLQNAFWLCTGENLEIKL